MKKLTESLLNPVNGSKFERGVQPLLENTDQEWVRDVDAEWDRFTKRVGEKLHVVASEAGGHDISVVASVYATVSDYENDDRAEHVASVDTSSSEGPAYDFISEMNELLQDDQAQAVWDAIIRDSDRITKEDEEYVSEGWE